MNKIEYSVNHSYVDHTYEVDSIFYSLLPTPYSLLPTPYSLLPTPYSPTPYSLLPYKKVISIFMT
ncbi:MAG: hypothetical protein F6J94_32385, partial [Moorea sp. SIO1F2]|nr:hypothetical protein [Moorena sp. SIO1F2]